jgi:hypothetical protein
MKYVETIVAVRKSTDDNFTSFKTLGEYNNQLNMMNIVFLVTYSDDTLTRTRVLTMTEEQKQQYDALTVTYAAECQAEQARKDALGIVETITWSTIDE